MAHLEWVIVPNSEVAPFLSPFSNVFPCFPHVFSWFQPFFFTKLHNPICHFAWVGLLHHGHLNDSTAQRRSFCFEATEAPVILFNDVSEMVFKASWKNPFFLAKGGILVFEICLNINLGNFLKSRTFINYKLHSYNLLYHSSVPRIKRKSFNWKYSAQNTPPPSFPWPDFQPRAFSFSCDSKVFEGFC